MSFYEKIGRSVVYLAPSIQELNDARIHDKWFWLRFSRLMKALNELLDKDRISSLEDLTDIENPVGGDQDLNEYWHQSPEYQGGEDE